MADQVVTLQQIRMIITSRPFHKWLGLDVVKVDNSGIEIKATWREEWVVHPEWRNTHGGILAALVDVAADYALCAKIGHPGPTIDLRVDYHKPAMPGDLIARGAVIRIGSQHSVAEAQVFDKDNALVASGRGVYFTALPKG